VTRRALVTGSASGIGLALVRRLAEGGASVVAVDVDEDRGAAAAAAAGARFVCADVASEDDWARVADAANGLDELYLNAGVIGGSTLGDGAFATYRRAVAVNVDGVVLGVAANASALAASRGSIVVTGSTAGLAPFELDPVYALTKHAVVGYVTSAAIELRMRGIRIHALCPTYVATPLLGEPIRTYLDVRAEPPLDPEVVAAALERVAQRADTGGVWTLGRDGRVSRVRPRAVAHSARSA